MCGEAMIPTHNTYVTLFILIMLSRKYPGSRWHVIRKDLPTLKATTIPSFERLCPSDAKIHRDPGNYRAEFANGSQIFFKAESIQQDPELKDFLGLETNGIFLEQAEEITERMHDRAKERTGSWYIDPMPPGFIFYTFNPTDNWVRETFYEPHKRGDLAAPYYYREALPSDNPFVTDDQWATWKEMDETVYLMMVQGIGTLAGQKTSSTMRLAARGTSLAPRSTRRYLYTYRSTKTSYPTLRLQPGRLGATVQNQRWHR